MWSRKRLAGDLPFGGVLRPDTNTVLVAVVASLLDDLDDTGTHVLAALSDLGVGLPCELVVPGLLFGEPLAGAEGAIVGVLLDGELKELVDGLDGLNGGEERLVAEEVVAVDGGAAGALGARDGDTVRVAYGRGPLELGGHLLVVVV